MKRVFEWCRGHPIVGIPLLCIAGFLLMILMFWAADWLVYWLPRPPKG